jgi:hypothetical protein
VWSSDSWEKARSQLTALDPAKYCEVLPDKEQVAMIRTVSRLCDEEVDGEMVSCSSENRSDLIAVATATVWTDTHITLRHPEGCGRSQADLEREMLEMVISLCPGGIKQTRLLRDSWDRRKRRSGSQLCI